MSEKKRATLRSQLAYEVREYLADLRNLFASLRSVEGMVALVLVLIIVGLTVAWFVLGLGFDRLLSVASSLGVARSTSCRDVDDVKGLFLVIGGVVFFLLAAFAIGEMMRLIDRVRQGYPGRPGAVLVPALAMLIVGLVGLTMMWVWC